MRFLALRPGRGCGLAAGIFTQGLNWTMRLDKVVGRGKPMFADGVWLTDSAPDGTITGQPANLAQCLADWD